MEGIRKSLHGMNKAALIPPEWNVSSGPTLLTLPPPGTCLILSLEPQRDVMWLKSIFLWRIWTWRHEGRQTDKQWNETGKGRHRGERKEQHGRRYQIYSTANKVAVLCMDGGHVVIICPKQDVWNLSTTKRRSVECFGTRNQLFYHYSNHHQSYHFLRSALATDALFFLFFLIASDVLISRWASCCAGGSSLLGLDQTHSPKDETKNKSK